MDKRRQIALRGLLYILDTAVILLALLLAFVLHVTLRDVTPMLKSPIPFREYALVAFFATPLWLALVPVFGLQKALERQFTGAELGLQLLKHHLTSFITLAVILFLTQTVINRSLVVLFMLCTFTLMYAVRAILTWRMRYEWRAGHGQARVLLVGAPGSEIAAFFQQATAVALPPKIVGRIGPPETEGVPADKPDGQPLFLGNTDRFAELLHLEPVDQVLFFPPFTDPGKAFDLLSVCETLGVPASFSIDLSRPGLAIPRVVSLFDQPFITFDVAPKPPGPRAFKHGFDAVASAIGLIVLSPVFLLFSLAILATTGRPVFFIQERAGLFGRPFRLLKFRTMVPGAEARRSELSAQNEMHGPVFKLTDDPRVTRLGRFLRRSSIDELPQLINVLVGTMSLVGPRPLPVEEQQQIRGWHRRRLSMKPGITGLWQVSGRSNVDFQDWMKLDLKYIDEWSLKLDAKILLQTVGAVLSKTGAK